MQGRLIADILDISRLDSGKLELRREPVPLAQVIEAAVETVRPQASSKRVSLSADLGQANGLVKGDPDRLQQVVWNLLVNALKFAPEGGNIEVRMEALEGQVAIEVRDDGPGIDPRFLPHIFEAFRQGDTSTTRRHGGLGLGLAIAHRIVALHDGQIHATNRTDRTGAVLRFTLPVISAALERSDEAASEGQARRALPPRLAGLKILVVDDEADAREVLATGLKGYGALVVSCASVAEGLAALAREHWDVLVSDIAMPERDGCDLIATVRTADASYASISAIALTAYSAADDVSRALRAGFQVHIAKPVDTVEVARIVARLAKGAPLSSRSDARHVDS